MKELQSFQLDFAQCGTELDKFRQLLDARDELSERKDVLPFFKKRRHLSALMGLLAADLITPTRLAYEFSIFGDFTCDVAIGGSRKGSYCLVEFEDGRSDSVFRKAGRKATREWSPRFEHGYGQIIDWFWKTRRP